jgi:hypothetical protein
MPGVVTAFERSPDVCRSHGGNFFPTGRSFPNIGIARIVTLLFFDINRMYGTIATRGKNDKVCHIGKNRLSEMRHAIAFKQAKWRTAAAAKRKPARC